MYAWVCDECQHLCSGHLLADEGTLVDGPYLCACGCAISQKSPATGISKRQFDAAGSRLNAVA